MKKLSTNPIDQYFREVLKSPDLKYNKQDWKGFEKMLPQKSKNKGPVWRFTAAAAAASVLLFTSLWLLNRPLTTTQKEKQETPGIEFRGSDLSFEKRTPSKEVPSAQLEGKGTTASIISESDKQGAIISKSKSRLAVLPVQRLKTPLMNSFPLVSFSTLRNLQKPDSLLFNTQQLGSLTLIPPIQSEQAKKPLKLEKSEDGRFSLGLSFSPDINSIQSSKSSYGNSFGLSASYLVNPRLSVNTAITYSKKVYSALPHEYKAPWATSNTAKYAESIDADCRVLSIPLNLQYSFLTSPKRTFFASAGVSSYFMLKEKYTIILEDSPGAYPARPNPSYVYKNQNQHLLSVLNFSAGMEKPISKQTSLVIEPYARLPLTGIGQGKVNLKSIGLNFQLQYNLKKKPKSKATPVIVSQ